MAEILEERPKTTRRSLLTSRVTPGMALVVIGAIAVLRLWVVETAYVEGRSMMETLQQGDRVLVLKPLEPKRFGIVVLVDPQEGGIDIKRVVGMPGEVVSMVPHLVGEGERQVPVGSDVYINAKPLEEPYASSVLPKVMAPRKVPEGKYFVMGDNRDDSVDSRSYGPIDGKSVRGVAVAVVYPFGRARVIAGKEAVRPASGEVRGKGE